MTENIQVTRPGGGALRNLSDSTARSRAANIHALTSHMVMTPVHAFFKDASVKTQTMFFSL